MISLREAAGRIDVTPATLRQAIRRRRLEATKIGGVWVTTPAALYRYYHSAPDAWKKRRAGGSASGAALADRERE